MRSKKLLKVKIAKGPKIRDAKGIQESFAYILKLVQDRWTISEAVELANVDRKAFYKCISEKQKQELHLAKSAYTIYGSIAKMSTGNKKQHSPEKEDEEIIPDAHALLIEQSMNIDWDF